MSEYRFDRVKPFPEVCHTHILQEKRGQKLLSAGRSLFFLKKIGF